MPAPFAFLVAFVLGATLAWFARVELARSEAPLVLARPFAIAGGLAVFVFAPVIGYFVAFHGDWAYLYLVEFRRVPSAVDLLLVVLATAQIPIGFAIAAPLARSKQSSRLLVLVAILLAMLTVVSVVAMRRLGTSASFTHFHKGFGAVPIGRSPLGRTVLLAWAVLAAAYAWAVHAVRSPRRRAR